MANWIYTARKRFTPQVGDGWADYIKWIGFAKVKEMVTIDYMLCPNLITVLTDADWSHNVHVGHRTSWFHDLTYTRQRCDWRPGHDQIIAMLDSPEVEHTAPTGFAPCGFDIVDGFDAISVLSNCGRLPGIVDPLAVNAYGLLTDLATATTIAEVIRETFPDDPHCNDCNVWQIARDDHPSKQQPGKPNM